MAEGSKPVTCRNLRTIFLYFSRLCALEQYEKCASKVLERHKLIGIPEMEYRFFAFNTFESDCNMPELRNYFALYFRFAVC